jgi:hypothetical protein
MARAMLLFLFSCCIVMAVTIATSDSDGILRLLEVLPVRLPGPTCSNCDWTSVQDLGVQGRALFPSFPERESFYDRLPLAAKNQVRPVLWTLSTMSAGMYCEFTTSSPVLFLNVSYSSPELSMYIFQLRFPNFICFKHVAGTTSAPRECQAWIYTRGMKTLPLGGLRL